MSFIGSADPDMDLSPSALAAVSQVSAALPLRLLSFTREPSAATTEALPGAAGAQIPWQ